MQKLMNLKNKKGFTLIEMLVVILIIVVLIAIAVPAVSGYRNDANETADKGAAETLFNALEAATTTHNPAEPANIVGASIGTAPATNQLYSTAVLTRDDLTGPYLEAVNEFLGASWDGSFTFHVTLSTGSVNWVAYRPEGASATPDNIMLFHAVDGVTGYLDEVINPNSGALYADGRMLHKI